MEDRIRNIAMENTIIPRRKVNDVVRLIENTTLPLGDVAEVGVYGGGFGLLLAACLHPRTVHLFDTFSGIPFSGPFDNCHKEGDFGDVDVLAVKSLVSGWNCEFHIGIFPDETGHTVKELMFSVVHLDVDVYQSYLDSLKFFYPRMFPGALVLLDDYDCHTCEGATRAVDEFLADKPESVSICGVQHYFVKG